MLARREQVSLRSVVAGTGLSTMAVYTYFDGMPGLLGAVRQEGFRRLAARLAVVTATDDPVSDVAAAGSAYAATAAQSPQLYAVMFDGALPLPDPDGADASLRHLAEAIGRAAGAGGLHPDLDAGLLANEVWMLGHGGCMLVVAGVLTLAQVEPVLVSGLERLLVAAGGDPQTVPGSVADGWARGQAPPGRG